jgi:hypothetical protein
MSPVDVSIDADGTSDFSKWLSEVDLTPTMESDGSVRVVRSGSAGDNDFMHTIDLSAKINRCPSCRMRLDIVGGQTVGSANDVTITVKYVYVAGSVWLNVPGASSTLPSDDEATTSIDFQQVDPAYPSQLRLRINFAPSTVSTEFLLRSVKLYAMNECGEGVLDDFVVSIAAEKKYEVSVESSVSYQISHRFIESGADTRDVTASFILNGRKFTTKDQDNDEAGHKNCAASSGGGWWYSACHAGILTGKYPNPARTMLPSPATGVNIKAVTNSYSSNLQTLEMSIKADAPPAGPVVTTCADLSLDGCRCVDRPLIHGGQHSMGVWCFPRNSTADESSSSHNVWHVATDGDDDQGVGSEERPMATISAAIGRGVSGDLIQLMPGIHKGGDVSCSWCTEVPVWEKRQCQM